MFPVQHQSCLKLATFDKDGRSSRHGQIQERRTTAWRCRSRNNLSTIDEAFTDCALPTPAGPTPLWGHLDQFQTTGQTSVDFSNHWVPIVFGRCAYTVLSPSDEERSACDRLIKVAIMRHGFIWISSTGATLGPSKENMIGTFPSKVDLQLVHTGTKKRRFSEVMSDHSLSS